MNEWWKNIEPVTKDQAREMRRNYFRLFLGDSGGRRVLAHLNLAASSAATEAEEPALKAFEIQTRINFVKWIRSCCGPTDELAGIKASSHAADDEPEETEEQRDRLEGFTED